jgi:hypothetical protein
MSTRAVYTFKDSYSVHSVYKHHDGYPEGAAEFISKARALAWPGQRFEAADFSAAFVAANKDSGGGVYLTKNHQSHGDLSYRYEISWKDGAIHVEAFERSYDEIGVAKYKKIFRGSLESFTNQYQLVEA